MARFAFTWARAAVVAVACATQVAAQTCYYPSGDVSTSEFACSTAQGSACCPDKWICMDNGLCALPSQNLTGRYSCTDQSWDSPGCPSNLCTYNMAATGAENLKQCADHNNQWCCNGDNSVVKCCEGIPQVRPFFNLQDGNAYATIGQSTASTAPTLNRFTGIAVATTSVAASTSSSIRSSSASSRSSSTTSAAPVTSVQTSVSSGAGGVSTAVITIIITPTASASGDSSNNSGGSGTNIGLIVGLAVGLPLAFVLAGIIFWVLLKRRNQKKANPYSDMDSDDATLAGAAAAKSSKKDVYRHSRPGTAEIDSMPVADTARPISHINGRAELGAGTDFQPGTGAPYGPDTVGIGGGSVPDRSTWGSSPPGYSPGMGQAAFNHQGLAELDSTPVMPVINEKAELSAYQPPANNAVEMPTVVTPPEEVEKRV